jgi:hypothetical protein
MCSYANRETVAKALGIYNAGNEQQTEVKYICVKFVVDDDEMVPFPEFFNDIQILLHADLMYSPVLCAAKDEISVDIMGRMFCCNFLRKSRL